MATEPDVLELIGAYRAGDDAARDKLVEQYLPLVRNIASRYSGRGEPLEDLIQVGSIGLVLAIQRFDVDRGVKFTTYAVPTIVGEIQRHFRDRAWAIHVPRRMKELSLKLTRTIEALSADLGRSPTIAELAEEAELEHEEVVEALETYHAYSTRSLSQPLGLGEDGEGTVEDLFGGPDVGYDEVENTALLESGLSALDERERMIVELRFYDGLTQSEIASPRRHLPDARLEAAAQVARRHARPARGRSNGAGLVSDTVKLTIPAKADYLVLCRLVLSGIAMQTRMSEIELADLKLAVTEVCGNAVQHGATAATGVVRIVYRVEPDAIEVSVEDDGAGPAFLDMEEAALTDGPAESGMGLAIVRAVMDEVVLEDGASAQGTVVRMRKRLAAT